MNGVRRTCFCSPERTTHGLLHETVRGKGVAFSTAIGVDVKRSMSGTMGGSDEEQNEEIDSKDCSISALNETGNKPRRMLCIEKERSETRRFILFKTYAAGSE